MENRVRVGVRIRPLSSKEADEGSSPIVSADSSKRLKIVIPAKNTKYDFDWVFGQQSNQEQVYDSVAAPLIENFFNGFNGTIFAYGQTGSGKTHTMGGGGDNHDGIVYKAIDQIFQKAKCIQESDPFVSIAIQLSYLEIYKEECFDLLGSEIVSTGGKRTPLQIREIQGATVVDGLSNFPIVSTEEACKLLQRATESRSTNKTAMNSQSSRSHSLCSLTLRISNTSANEVTVSRLHLVDLAGSERAKKTLATGDIFNEGVSINKGLLALGNVVAALAAKSLVHSMEQEEANSNNNGNRHIHVPYRESKLTRLLKDSLGGNGMTVLLACVSPSDSNVEETINTLKFATRALAVVNHAQVNREQTESNNDLEARQQILELKQQLKSLQLKCDMLTAQHLLTENQKSVDNNSNNISSSNSAHNSTNNQSNSVTRTATSHQSLAGVLMLATSLKSILRQNFEEDIELNEDELWMINEQVSQLNKKLVGNNNTLNSQQRNSNGSSNENSELDLGMPPILIVMETIMSLEDTLSHLLNMNSNSSASTIILKSDQTNNGAIASSTSSSSSSMIAMFGSIDPNNLMAEYQQSLSNDENDREEEEAESVGNLSFLTKEKEEELTTLMTLTVTVEESLDSLRKEVAQLETERKKLLQQQQLQQHHQGSTKLSNNSNNNSNNSSIAATAAAADLKLKQQLKEKSQLLESKLQLLRSKENECQKLLNQKEKSTKELQTLQTQLQESNRNKVVLMKKMRSDNVQHLLERKQLQQQDAQTRRKEMIAQIKLAKLERQMIQKEIVWREQLQKANSKQAINSTSASSATVSTNNNNHNNKSSNHRNVIVNSLKFRSPKYQQQLTETIEEELKRQMHLQFVRNQLEDKIKERTIIAKQLASKKLVLFNTVSDSENGILLTNTIEEMEMKIKSFSVEIIALQAEIGNMEESNKCISEVSSVEESKAIITMLFSRLVQSEKQINSKLQIENNQLQKSANDQQKKRSVSEIEEKIPINNNNNSNNNCSNLPATKKPMLTASSKLTNSSNSSTSCKQTGITAKPTSTSSILSGKTTNNSSNLPSMKPTVKFAMNAIATTKATTASSTSVPLSKQSAIRPALSNSNRPIASNNNNTSLHNNKSSTFANNNKSTVSASNKSNAINFNNNRGNLPIGERQNKLSAAATALKALSSTLNIVASASESSISTSGKSLECLDKTASASNKNVESEETAQEDEELCEEEEEEDYDEFVDEDDYSDYSDSEDELDESFYPEQDELEEEDDEDDDDYYSSRRRRQQQTRRKQQKTTENSRNNNNKRKIHIDDEDQELEVEEEGDDREEEEDFDGSNGNNRFSTESDQTTSSSQSTSSNTNSSTSEDLVIQSHKRNVKTVPAKSNQSAKGRSRKLYRQSSIVQGSEVDEDNIHNSDTEGENDEEECLERHLDDEENNDKDEEDQDSFLEDDDDDEEEDENYGRKKKRKKAMIKNNNNSCKSKKITQNNMNISFDLLAAVEQKPINKLTVAELKNLLRNCGCVMTGLKEDLIKRLQHQIDQQRQQQQQNEKENISFSESSAKKADALNAENESNEFSIIHESEIVVAVDI